MIWTERIALGLYALVVVAFTAGYFLNHDTLVKKRVEQEASNAECMAFQQKHGSKPANESTVDAIDEYLLKRGCKVLPPEELQVVPTISDLLVALAKAAGAMFVCWLVLRIIDFMFGGPVRRRRSTQAASTAQPGAPVDVGPHETR